MNLIWDDFVYPDLTCNAAPDSPAYAKPNVSAIVGKWGLLLPTKLLTDVIPANIYNAVPTNSAKHLRMRLK